MLSIGTYTKEQLADLMGMQDLSNIKRSLSR